MGIVGVLHVKIGARIIMARVAIGVVQRIMVILIVVICGIVVEPPAVPRSSSVATTAATSPTSTTPSLSAIISRFRLLLAIYKFEGCV